MYSCVYCREYQDLALLLLYPLIATSALPFACGTRMHRPLRLFIHHLPAGRFQILSTCVQEMMNRKLVIKSRNNAPIVSYKTLERMSFIQNASTANSMLLLQIAQISDGKLIDEMTTPEHSASGNPLTRLSVSNHVLCMPTDTGNTVKRR